MELNILNMDVFFRGCSWVLHLPEFFGFVRGWTSELVFYAHHFI